MNADRKREQKEKYKKKGISPVIATILLILLSVTAVIIISGLIIPFVKNTTKESKECFDVMDQLTINTESGYTCYYNNGTNNIANLTIKRGTKETTLSGFIIAVSGGGNSKTFEIISGTVNNVKMINGSDNIEIPKKGEERTYSITTDLLKIEYAEVAPIMEDGKMCNPTDKADINLCF